VLDAHDDTTQRLFSKDYDLGKQNQEGHVDIPRMREGGMNAIFFSIWIDGRITGPPAVQKALDQIDAVRENVKKYSKDMVLARTAEDVRHAHEQGKIAALKGVEGGHMIGNDIRIARIFADLGVRYMTLSLPVTRHAAGDHSAILPSAGSPAANRAPMWHLLLWVVSCIQETTFPSYAQLLMTLCLVTSV